MKKYFAIIFCLIFCSALAQAVDLTPWLNSVEKIDGEGDNREKHPQGSKDVLRSARKATAKLVAETKSLEESNDYADAMVLLIPVFQNLSQPVIAGKKLAKVLNLSEAEVSSISSVKDLVPYLVEIEKMVHFQRLKKLASHYDSVAMERALHYLMAQYPDQKSEMEQFLKELNEWKLKLGDLSQWIAQAQIKDEEKLRKLVDLRRKALVKRNPELSSFKDWVAVRRYAGNGSETNRNQDRPANWQGISSMSHAGKFYWSEIVRLSSGEADGCKILSDDRWVGHLTPDFDGKKLMFTGNNFNRGNKRHWDVSELDLTTLKAEPLTDHMPADTDSYDSCYLPDGRILFINTSGYQGVPCVGGEDYVGNIHLLDREKKTTRRLTMDQDNNWFPTMLHDGRVMFLRWEYTESAHYFSRILMHMNPDGTDQKEYYGSNSYWPNSLFNAKAIPGKPGQFVGIVSGHHGIQRVGELVLFDVNKGRQGTHGAIQKIPGFGKEVADVTKDQLVNNIKTPYFAEPYPLSDHFFMASCSLDKNNSSMNIVVCDVFDNIIPLTASNYFLYGDPFPVQGRTRPPAIPDRIKEGSPTATAYITDVYEGRAMKGVPRGEAKSIRVFISEYSPRDAGGHYVQGMESNWDVKVLYGTAPVLKDGSAMFEVPANQPVTVQVLDDQGRALALMRSWFTAMQGEVLSCIGCHENQNDAPPSKLTLASRTKPVPLTPWYGEKRSFSFLNEVQPVLDRHCISCHTQGAHDKLGIPDFATTTAVQGAPAPGSVSYWSLHPYVRRNGPEGNYLGLMATEFFADTSELYQLLKKGHHGVRLNQEDLNRIVTWIDMNVPYMGYWPGDRNESYLQKRYDALKQYSTAQRDYLTMDDSKYKRSLRVPTPVIEKAKQREKAQPHSKNFPFTVQEEPESVSLDLGNGVKMALREIAPSQFVMGSDQETDQESPKTLVSIKNPYWIGETEVTLEQYRCFDPSYENGWYDMHYKDQVRPGYNMNDASFPVIRVSWEKAMEFCAWLSQKAGKKVSLPTEAQWEFAARGGAGTPFFFGEGDADFSPYANLADTSIKKLAVSGVDPQPMKNPNRFFDFVPRDEKFDDKVLHLAPVASYKPNPFHLYDMIGNVAEWTRSAYKSYPYQEKDGRNKIDDGTVSRVVRGGSWRDRPKRATASWRLSYPGWRPVYNVGFRVVVEG
ncbi:MAG: SUMF1/EgtB/PvdO family nonheme iron enzyme [Akkermansia sp.]